MRSRAILSAFLVLGAVACGILAPAPTPTPSSPLPSPRPPTPTPTPTRESQPMIIALSLWLPEEMDPYGDRPGAPILAQQLTDFSQANPNLQVEVTIKKAHGRGGLLDFLRTARDAAPSVLPDLVVLDATDLQAAARSNLVRPLDLLLSPDQLSDRFPFASGLGTMDEQTLGFALGADMQHLAYRTSLPGSPPVSWTQVISPPTPFIFPAGGQDGQINDATLIQYLAAGGKLTDADGNPSLDEDVMISVLGFYSECIATGAIPPLGVLDITDADQSWDSFRAGWGTMAVAPSIRYWLEADETLAAASVPTRDGHPFSIARGWVIALVADDPARQGQAMHLLNWLISPDHSAEWTQAAGYLPPTRTALRMWRMPDGERAALRGVMEAAIPPPPPELLATVGPAMQQALETVLRRQATPEEAVATAAQSLRR